MKAIKVRKGSVPEQKIILDGNRLLFMDREEREWEVTLEKIDLLRKINGKGAEQKKKKGIVVFEMRIGPFCFICEAQADVFAELVEICIKGGGECDV